MIFVLEVFGLCLLFNAIAVPVIVLLIKGYFYLVHGKGQHR